MEVWLMSIDDTSERTAKLRSLLEEANQLEYKISMTPSEEGRAALMMLAYRNLIEISQERKRLEESDAS